MNVQNLRQKAIDQGLIPDLGGQIDGHLMQNPDELALFVLWLEGKKIDKKYLEIGVSYGGLMKYLMSLGYEAYGIDPFNPCEVERTKVCPHLSNDRKAKKYAEENGPYGFVFIDGDHTYEGVKYDFENYKKFSKIIVFHDILGKRDCEGVKKFWKELNDKGIGDRRIEFVSSDPLYQVGIGVVVND